MRKRLLTWTLAVCILLGVKGKRPKSQGTEQVMKMSDMVAKTPVGNTNDNFQNDTKALNRATDRCDGKGIIILESAGEDTNWKQGGTCGAQAHVKVVNPRSGYDLLFCGHHYNLYADKLWEQGFGVVIDTRESLVFNRKIGSEN